MVNYGLGGQYEPHLDYFFDDVSQIKNKIINDTTRFIYDMARDNMSRPGVTH